MAHHTEGFVAVPDRVVQAGGELQGDAGLAGGGQHRGDTLDGGHQVGRHAAPGHQVMVGFPVIAVARVAFRVHDLEVAHRAHRQAIAFAAVFDHVGAADQDGLFGGFLEDRLRRA